MFNVIPDINGGANNKLKITVFSTDHQLITAMPIFNVYLENSSNPSYINTFNNHFTFHFDFENKQVLQIQHLPLNHI